jgi:hypothetical protein
MDDLHQDLRQLAQTACTCSKDTPNRRHYVDQLIQQLIQSGKLWRKSALPEEDYQDILQKSWIYLWCNLCEATTAAAPYDPDRASVVTWINAYIKMRTLDACLELEWKRRNHAYTQESEQGSQLDPIDILPAPAEPPPIVQELLAWLERDRHLLLRIHIRGHFDLNCHSLILRRLPPQETPWCALAQEFAIPEQTLRGFYRQKCLPRLKEAGKHLGYL